MARRCNRYCIDCGGRMTYYPNLSNPKARNEDRVLVYACVDCTKTFEKPCLLAVQRSKSEDPLQTVRVHIINH